jgi:hypothetical protein
MEDNSVFMYLLKDRCLKRKTSKREAEKTIFSWQKQR